MSGLYHSVDLHASRRKYCKHLKSYTGKCICIRLKLTASDDLRKQAFSWCQQVVCYWGCDGNKRRFYFSKASEAVRFKLAWGGDLA